jgi:hypothetical protein
MSNRLDNRRLTTLEAQAYAEASEHFAQHLRQFSATLEAIKHLERDLAKIAVAANIVAARPPSGNALLTGDAQPWHKALGLMDNIHLCHRTDNGKAQYAIVEHLPESGRNEVLFRGRNVIELLQQFGQEQRRALEIWPQEMSAPVSEFFAQKYPGQDLNRVTSTFMLRFTHPVILMPNHLRQGAGKQSLRI